MIIVRAEKTGFQVNYCSSEKTVTFSLNIILQMIYN